MRERVGGTGWDREQQTGRLLTFPNNLILKEPVTNHTRENDIIWHSYDVTITFESDHVKTRAVLESVCEDQFKSALKNEKEYFKGVKNLAQFKPKLYMHISANGPQFTIWFATKIGHFRERAEKYSEDILTRFNKENIALAYTTSRIILHE
jgi:small-conductance mechanosensitive channel